MFSFFEQVTGWVNTLFQFFINLIESLLQAVIFLSSAIPFSTHLTVYMPSIVGSSIVCVVAIFLIKFLLGR